MNGGEVARGQLAKHQSSRVNWWRSFIVEEVLEAVNGCLWKRRKAGWLPSVLYSGTGRWSK